MTQIIKQFFLAYILSTIGIAMLGILLEAFFQFDIGSSGAFSVIALSAIYTGFKYAKRHGAAPKSHLSWKAALYTTPIVFITTILITTLMYLPSPNERPPFLNDPSIAILSITMGLVISSIIHILFFRFFFSFAAKEWLKIEKKWNSKQPK